MTSTQTEIKILSWNIFAYHPYKRDIIQTVIRIIDVIKDIDPDVLCLQECSNYVIECIHCKTKYKLVNRILTHGGYVCTFITEDKQVTNITINNSVIIKIGNITIYNCHFPPGNILHSQLSSLNIYEKSIIVGDLNYSNHIDIKNLCDVGEDTNIPTWFASFFEANNNKQERYDRICVTTDLIYDRFDVHSSITYISDHVPISIYIRIP
jgi:endonuclease/exonuclease/phosphatase family metal-dependent hydrolase